MPFDQVMPKFKSGSLKSGSGSNVTNPKQAVAIIKKSKTRPEYSSKTKKPTLYTALGKK